MGGQTISTDTEILANPMYPTTAAGYVEYHQTMQGMETELTTMHRMVNSLYEKQKQLESLLSSLPASDKFSAIKKEGEALLKKMKVWDEAWCSVSRRPTTTLRTFQTSSRRTTCS